MHDLRTGWWKTGEESVTSEEPLWGDAAAAKHVKLELVISKYVPIICSSTTYP